MREFVSRAPHMVHVSSLVRTACERFTLSAKIKSASLTVDAILVAMSHALQLCSSHQIARATFARPQRCHAAASVRPVSLAGVRALPASRKTFQTRDVLPLLQHRSVAGRPRRLCVKVGRSSADQSLSARACKVCIDSCRCAGVSSVFRP